MGEWLRQIIATLFHFILCRLKPLDIEFMKQLHHLVNIIPVIAKADTLTASELKTLKTKVLGGIIIMIRYWVEL